MTIPVPSKDVSGKTKGERVMGSTSGEEVSSDDVF